MAKAEAEAASGRRASTSTPTDAPLSQPAAPSEATASSRTQTVRVDQPPDAKPSVVPVRAATEVDPDLDAIGEPDQEIPGDGAISSDQERETKPLEQFISEDGTPMLNPGELDSKRPATPATAELTVLPVAELLTQVR